MEKGGGFMRSQRPVVGILVWSTHIRRTLRGEYVPRMELAVDAAKSVGVELYFFRLSDVDLQDDRIHGWTRNQNGKWERSEMPWPDVVHLATLLSKKKNSKGQRVKRRIFRQAKAINSLDVLGKWEVHWALSKFKDTQEFIPETRLYENASDLASMLKKHWSVLAKPRYGFGAQNISRVWNMGSGLFGWEDSSTGEKLTELRFDELVGKVLKNAQGRFVVQEELRILEVEQKRNKVRVIMSKDGRGSWRHALSYAFIGHPGQFAVSRHQGATQLPLPKGLSVFGIKGLSAWFMAARLVRVAMLTVRRLEQALGPMGEIGLDLAIGEGRKVWVIEANARPNKNDLPFSDQRTVIRPFLLMMQYALFLWKSQ